LDSASNPCIRTGPTFEETLLSSEHSEQMMVLLQELASLKELDEQSPTGAGERQRRRREISELMHQLAEDKKTA